MRYLCGFPCVFALGVVPLVGCDSTSGTGGSGGTGGNDNWVPLDYETNPHSAKYDFSAVDSAVADFMDAYGVAGLTLAVVRRDAGQIYEKGYGDFGRDHHAGMWESGIPRRKRVHPPGRGVPLQR